MENGWNDGARCVSRAGMIQVGWPCDGGGNGSIKGRRPAWWGNGVDATFVVLAETRDGLISPCNGFTTGLVLAAGVVILE